MIIHNTAGNTGIYQGLLLESQAKIESKMRQNLKLREQIDIASRPILIEISSSYPVRQFFYVIPFRLR